MQMRKPNVVSGQNSSVCTMGARRVRPGSPEDHRGLSSTLYMAKPRTANTVAPTLALSQKVELFKSAWLTCGYMAIVVSLVKMSLLGAAAVLQVKDWGGGILCLLQNSRGVQPYICLTSGRSDFAAIIIHGVLLSMKYCLKTLAQYSKE